MHCARSVAKAHTGDSHPNAGFARPTLAVQRQDQLPCLLEVSGDDVAAIAKDLEIYAGPEPSLA
jgi:hypothetical protein